MSAGGLSARCSLYGYHGRVLTDGRTYIHHHNSTRGPAVFISLLMDNIIEECNRDFLDLLKTIDKLTYAAVRIHLELLLELGSIWVIIGEGRR